MKGAFFKQVLRTTTLMSLISFSPLVLSAVGQSLNDTFFQNPAELSLINQTQWMMGNIYIAPELQYTGETIKGTGSAVSKANNNLPYLLGGYRLTDRFVFGINVTPSTYGHIEWPVGSLVDESSTSTEIIYYRVGAQSSYKVNEQLALGAGFNLEINKILEVDFVIPNQGNQINKVSGVNYTFDIGALYKINPRNSISAALYTPVDTFGSGKSSLNSLRSDNLYIDIAQAAVAFVGLQHQLTDKWYLGEKVYWSEWSMEKNIVFLNTVTGNYYVPVHWHNVWSYQVLSRYAATEQVAVLGSLTYETNANPTNTNKIGYPLAATLFLTGGLDFNVQKNLSAQLVYGYGFFTPKSKINYSDNHGMISANIQAVVIQLTYKK